jgi:hypothetical protein
VTVRSFDKVALFELTCISSCIGPFSHNCSISAADDRAQLKICPSCSCSGDEVVADVRAGLIMIVSAMAYGLEFGSARFSKLGVITNRLENMSRCRRLTRRDEIYSLPW